MVGKQEEEGGEIKGLLKESEQAKEWRQMEEKKGEEG